ncbi:hypothetical protein TSUD_250470 [Trifolium subterraneum]|nr:hypothetical protein TSUD_250470 [Trifolium subterraneum]
MEMSMEQTKATEDVTRKKGGLRTMPFIIANETIEKVANVGLHVNMTLYLLNEYHLDPSTAAIVIFLWNALSNFIPLFGAFLSDAFLGRFHVIALGTVIDLLGLVVLWLTSIIRNARPPDCDGELCAGPSGGQLLHLDLPPKNSDIWYFHSGSNLVQPTDKARFLNKACIIKNRDKDLDTSGMAIDPWCLCTVRKVEELKAVIKILPIWSAGIILSMSISQHIFPVVQAGTMNRVVLNLEIPATSFVAFGILTLTIWVAIYDRVLVPLLSKYAKGGLTIKQRLGIGLMLSCLATAVAALVERKRRNEAIREGFINNPKGVVKMSAMWLVPQYCITGLAEAFNYIGQIEFYYSQFPKRMASIAIALFSLGMGAGNLLGSIIVKVVEDGTGGRGKISWLSSNLNQGHYDYYYALLTLLSFVNLFYFFLCSWAYGGTEDIKTWDEEVDTK